MPVTRGKAASESTFVYLPLDKAVPTSFRIVTILPDDPQFPLSCTLSPEDWQDPVLPYETLSYFWGDRSLKKSILIDGRPLHITSNLESALLHLRHGFEGEPRRLWVDAICINQADTQERNQQVRQMFHIYNRAQQVNVWLGDGNAESNRTLHFINAKLGPCFESVGFSCADEHANVASGFWEEWDEGKDEECWGAIDHLIVKKQAKSWINIAKLLCRPWWSRAWTVQELISSQRVTVLCGSSSVPWPLLDMTIQMMLRNIKVEELYPQKKRALFHNAVEDAYGFAYERSHRILDGTDSLDFVMLMQITRYRDCQDARDKVFSVLSLLSNEFQTSFCVDYLQPIRAVYAGAARSYILHASDLHILSSCFYSSKASISDLPSWVPDWGRQFGMSYLAGYSKRDTDYSFRASGESSAAASFSHDLQTLTASGLHIGTVENSRLQETDSEFEFVYDEDRPHEEPSCIWDIHQIATALEHSDKKIVMRRRETSVLKAVLYTLIVDRDPIRGKRRQPMKLTKVAKQPSSGKLWPEPVYDYLAHVTLWSQERTLILSDNGYLGLAPSTTLPGDRICILHGMHAPAILRSRPDGESYTLIGDAYVHALMDGEAVAPNSRAKFKTELFNIR